MIGANPPAVFYERDTGAIHQRAPKTVKEQAPKKTLLTGKEKKVLARHSHHQDSSHTFPPKRTDPITHMREGHPCVRACTAHFPAKHMVFRSHPNPPGTKLMPAG